MFLIKGDYKKQKWLKRFAALSFDLVVFYDISTLVGYLMTNPVYIYDFFLFFVGLKREKREYFKINWFTKGFIFQIIYFTLTYVSSMLLLLSGRVYWLDL